MRKSNTIRQQILKKLVKLENDILKDLKELEGML